LILVVPALGLTPDEIAMFSPDHYPDHIEVNTGKRARYSLVDNGDGSLTFSGNDIPPHDTWVFPRKSGNPHDLKESPWNMTINKDPVMRKTPFKCLPHGAIGVATSGIEIYGNWPSEKKCPFVPGFEELDICDGHPSPNKAYHHHYYSHCINNPVCGEPSPIVGVALDGIPIYGPYDENGRQLTAQDTDECGGRLDSAGRYKYHMTIDPPYFMDCLWGEIRVDMGLKQSEFHCSCPFDDNNIGGPRPPIEPCEKEPCPQPGPPPPGPELPLVCDFSGPGPNAVCIDKYNTSSVMGVEWVRVMKTIDLAPCCPKGMDCGVSCKTEEGVKAGCVVEQREVAFIETKPSGWCLNKCSGECTKESIELGSEMSSEADSEEMGSEEGSEEVPTGDPKPEPTKAPKPIIDPRCLDKCMTFCKTKKGQNN